MAPLSSPRDVLGIGGILSSETIVSQDIGIKTTLLHDSAVGVVVTDHLFLFVWALTPDRFLSTKYSW